MVSGVILRIPSCGLREAGFAVHLPRDQRVRIADPTVAIALKQGGSYRWLAHVGGGGKLIVRSSRRDRELAAGL